MGSYLPDKGEQLVRYYSHTSNAYQGKRKKATEDSLIPYILEPSKQSIEYRKNRARVIQRIYEVDLLRCPKCQESKIISFIEDEGVIEKISKHFGLWGCERPTSSQTKGSPFEDSNGLFRFSDLLRFFLR